MRDRSAWRLGAAALVVVGTAGIGAADEDAGPPPSVAWEQWALSIPTAENPISDTTGADCMLGQRGPVWFLGGLWGGGSAKRSCAIPEHTELFFPVINTVNVNSPNVCGQGPQDMTPEELRAAFAGFIDGASDLSVELDGHQHVAEIRRIVSPPFAVALPDGNLFDVFCGGPGSVPGGVYSPGVDDGIYATIGERHLRPGHHTLHFHVEQKAAGFVEDITYELDVVRVKLEHERR
jgi:hypothetical protein